MATHPEDSAADRPPGRSWSALVAHARLAPTPEIDVRVAVLAALSSAPRPRTTGLQPDVFSEFSRLFGSPLSLASCGTGTFAFGVLALWRAVGHLDAFSRIALFGNLPGWLVAALT